MLTFKFVRVGSTSGKYLLVSTLVLASFGLNAQITSTFNVNAEGWTTPNDADGTISYAAAGGNPGGLVAGSPFVLVLGASTFYLPFNFVAPVAYRGNRSTYYNGTLRYDIQQSTTGAPNQYAEVTIANSGGVTLYYYPTISNQPAAAPTWTTFSVTMNNALGFWKTSNSVSGTAAMEAQLQSVLVDLAALEIRGLYRDANTTNRLDNVSFRPPIIVNTQPASTTICNGVTTSLTTAASGNPTLTYQWQLETSPSVWANVTNTSGYSGATTASLSVNTTGNFGAGNYRCQISGLQVDNAFTSTAAIAINSTPAPTASDVSVCPGTIATLTASGGTNGQYRWYTVASGGTAIAGQTNGTFVTSGVSVVTTFYASIDNGTCESLRTPVVVTPIGSACAPPSITPATISVIIDGNKSLDLKTLITITSGTLDVNSISVTVPPSSGAKAVVTTGVLTLDYQGITFAGKETITIRACDTFGNCSTQQIEIEVSGDITVYNGISPNGDLLNEAWIIRYIEILDETKTNKVSVYNRWGDLVWETENYNNKDRVFKGLSKSGNELPSGIYFYKIEFTSGRKTLNGYLAVKK